jgi:hypothetical protein
MLQSSWLAVRPGEEAFRLLGLTLAPVLIGLSNGEPGWGRRKAETLPALLQVHHEVAAAL